MKKLTPKTAPAQYGRDQFDADVMAVAGILRNVKDVDTVRAIVQAALAITVQSPNSVLCVVEICQDALVTEMSRR